MMMKGLFVAVLILGLSAAVRGAWPWCQSRRARAVLYSHRFGCFWVQE
jgi:hypothetical protein